MIPLIPSGDGGLLKGTMSEHDFLFVKGMSKEECQEAVEWYETRPPKIRALIKKVPPGRKYHWKNDDGTTSLVPYVVKSYSEPDDEKDPCTLVVIVLSPLFPREVFGVSANQLVPWRDN